MERYFTIFVKTENKKKYFFQWYFSQVSPTFIPLISEIMKVHPIHTFFIAARLPRQLSTLRLHLTMQLCFLCCQRNINSAQFSTYLLFQLLGCVAPRHPGPTSFVYHIFYCTPAFCVGSLNLRVRYSLPGKLNVEYAATLFDSATQSKYRN